MSTPDTKDPAVARRRLAKEVRTLRQTATQRDVAEAMDWSTSKLLRIENAQTGITANDLRALLGHYGVTEPARVDFLVGLAQLSRRPPANAYRDVLVGEFATYLRYESSASMIRQYHPTTVPGLLQTEEYARALIMKNADRNADGKLDREGLRTVERQIDARMLRKAVLDSDTLIRAHFIVDEAALRRPVEPGEHGAAIMRRQLTHLRELAQNERITVNVLPFDAGVQAGAQWPFVLLDFTDDDPFLYLEGFKNTATRDDPAAVVQYTETFMGLEKVAIGGADLAPWLAGLTAGR